jgi:hypothetical protein
MNQSLSFNVTTGTAITRYLVGFTPANAGETAILNILRTADDSGYFYGDLSEHGGDIINADSISINNIVSGSSVSTTIARRAAALLVKINSSPSLSDIISFGFINSTHIRRSIPVSNISLRDIATEFNSTTTNSKIRLYSGGESGVAATATGVQRSFSEFANKEFKIIKYLSNSSSGVNLTTLFSTDLDKINSKKAIANTDVLIGATTSTSSPIQVTVSWTGNIDLVNYGVIMGAPGKSGAVNGGNVINMPSSIDGTLQVVNFGELLAGGGAGGRGGYGANGFLYNNAGSIIVNYGVGGDPGAYSPGAGYAQLAINYNVGSAGNLGSISGKGGNSSHGGIYGQSAGSGLLGANGLLIRQSCTTIQNTTPLISGIRAPQIGGVGGYVIIGNGKTYYSEFGSNSGAISGVVNIASGIGEVVAPPTSTQYIIPKDSIILYNGADPNYYEWEFFADATDKFIKGTATQGEIGTIVAESGSTSISVSGLTASIAGAHVNNTTTLQGRGSAYSAYIYNDIDGDHTHVLSASAITGNPIPAKSKFTLLRAISDQKRFPPNTKFINETSRSLNSSIDLATTVAGNKYIVGYNLGHALSAQVGASSTISTGYGGGAHSHNVDLQVYPSEQLYTASQLGATRGATPDLRSHTHAPSSLTIYLDSLAGKLLSIWDDATSTILCTNDILMYCGDLSLLPSYWKICDGTNGTVDMRNYFFGHATTGQTHGQESLVNYTFPASLGSLSNSTWTHSHYGPVQTYTYDAGPNFGSHLTYSASHTHIISGTPTATSDYLPAHIKLAFIKFVP